MYPNSVAPDTAKIIVIGDSAVGKTCLLMTLQTGSFPEEYIPTFFDESQLPPMKYEDKEYKFILHDSVSRGDYDILRIRDYVGLDLIIICFAIISEASFINVKERWLPELEYYKVKAPFILLGLKEDLRGDPNILQSRQENQRRMISFEDGKKLAKEIGAEGYFEYSYQFNVLALVGTGKEELVKAIRDVALKSKLGTLPRRKQQTNSKCILS